MNSSTQIQSTRYVVKIMNTNLDFFFFAELISTLLSNFIAWSFRPRLSADCYMCYFPIAVKMSSHTQIISDNETLNVTSPSSAASIIILYIFVFVPYVIVNRRFLNNEWVRFIILTIFTLTIN